MVSFYWAISLAIAATTVSASTEELQFFSRLLKRQEPGSPAYNCHDNCGQAIIQARNSKDVCTDETFLTDYKNCLQCSGPDNEDIWQYYGNTLTKSAQPCGLSTTPLTGDQPDVGAAVAAGSSASTTAGTSSPSPSGSGTTAATTATSGSTVATTTEGAASSTGPTSTPAVTESATLPSASATSSASRNGTASATTSSAIVQANTAARALAGGSVGSYFALVVGALCVAVAQ
ncbi:hypothetical protein F5B20DRAFT_528709 [Whalleya microplaca]|nr:hypothetical protein F5B20DRAFT_528709 [Whalleya microplaca]